MFNATMSSATQAGAASHSTMPRGPPVVFHAHQDFEFFRADNSSYRATIYEVEKTPYVAISHWWFNRAHAAWYPSRKQIFLPKQAWLGLLAQKERISQVILPLEDTAPVIGGPGVIWTSRKILCFFL